MRRITAQNASFGVFLAFLLIPLSGIGTDIYLPSMPSMVTDLGTTAASIQLTLTLFIAGYGVGQAMAGVLLDRFGRYRPTLIALTLFVLSSVVIAVSDNIVLICALRLFQGLLGAVAVVAKRTFFVDVFSGLTLQRYLTWTTVAWAMGPICAPFIGGFVQTHWGWRANFVLLALFSAVILVLEFKGGGETLTQPQPIRPREVAARTWEILSHGPFVIGVLCVGTAYGIALSWSMASPFLIETVYRHPPTTTGSLALVMGLAWMTGGLLARALITQPLLRKQQGALVFMALAVGGMMLMPSDWRTLPVLTAVAFVIHTAAGLSFNIHFARVLSMFPKHAALSGGLVGGGAFLLASVLSATVISVVHPQSALGMAEAYGGLMAVLLLLTLRLRAPQAAPAALD